MTKLGRGRLWLFLRNLSELGQTVEDMRSAIKELSALRSEVVGAVQQLYSAAEHREMKTEMSKVTVWLRENRPEELDGVRGFGQRVVDIMKTAPRGVGLKAEGEGRPS